MVSFFVCVLLLQHLKFKETNLAMLQQFNALAQLHRIDQLTIDPQGNPVVNFTLWKYYVLFRLSHFNMQKINGTEVSLTLSHCVTKVFTFKGNGHTSDQEFK